MTIKKHIILLASLIIAIPLFCSFFIFFHNYASSEQRLLMKSTKEVQKIQTQDISKEEWDELITTIRLLPPHIQTIGIYNNDTIIYSTMPEYEANTKISMEDIWKYTNKTSNEYFYQFTAVNINEKNVLLISRIDRSKRNFKKIHNIVLNFELFLVVIVFICILVLIFIAKSIFESINFLQEKTEQIANGDLSEQIKKKNQESENEITSISDNLEKMRLSLLEAENRKNRFIMGISHDLRTPVAVIKGYTEAIADDIIVDKSEIKQSLQLIKTKTTQLEEMIDTLINYTRLNNSDIREKMVKKSITNFFNDYLKEVSVYGELINRKITTENLVTKNIELPFNEQLLHRALENLFSNARRYTKDGDSIQLKLHIEGSNLIFAMKDSGCGIAKEDLKNIFDLFFRGTNSRLEKGMGIGLSVVKNIISTHGWTINIDSEKGIGSTFSIIIPLEQE